MPIIHSMRALPKVPQIYDVRKALVERDRIWFGKGNMFLYPGKRDFKGRKMRFRVNELFDDMPAKFIGVPEHMKDFQMGRESSNAVFALSPEMVAVFADTTLIDTIVYRLMGRTIVVVKNILISKRMYDGQSFRRFNYRGMRTVRGFAASRKYSAVMLGAIINTYQDDNNMMGFAKKIMQFLPEPQSDEMVTEVIGAAFDARMFRRIDRWTANISGVFRAFRTARLSFMLVLQEKQRKMQEPNHGRTLILPLHGQARIEDRSIEELAA